MLSGGSSKRDLLPGRIEPSGRSFSPSSQSSPSSCFVTRGFRVVWSWADGKGGEGFNIDTAVPSHGLVDPACSTAAGGLVWFTCMRSIGIGKRGVCADVGLVVVDCYYIFGL